jgi:hypothetical protein
MEIKIFGWSWKDDNVENKCIYVYIYKKVEKYPKYYKSKISAVNWPQSMGGSIHKSLFIQDGRVYLEPNKAQSPKPKAQFHTKCFRTIFVFNIGKQAIISR